MSVVLKMNTPAPFKWFYLGAGGSAVVAGWAVVTQPWPDPLIAGIVLVFLVALTLRIRLLRPSELSGTTIRFRGFLRTHDVELVGARKVRLRPTPAGSAALDLIAANGARAYLAIFAMTVYIHDCLPPAVLDAVAEAVTVAADPRKNGVSAVLRLQAAHLRKGGSLEDSPMRPLTRGSWLRASGSDVVSMLDG